MNRFVYALAIYDNKLIAGGYFTTAGGKVSAYIAQWTKHGAGTIAGIVTSTGAGAPPISGASIVLIEHPEYSAKTNAQGQYSITRVPAGTYTVRASKSGYASQQASVQVTAGQTTTRDFVLSPTVPQLTLECWFLDGSLNKHDTYVGDHADLTLRFYNRGGPADNVHIELSDASAEVGRPKMKFQEPGGGSWMSSVGFDIANMKPYDWLDINVPIYDTIVCLFYFPEGNILPYNPKFSVACAYLTPNPTTREVQLKQRHFDKLDLPQQVPDDVTLLESDCIRSYPVDIVRYAQYAVGNPEKSFPALDSDTRELACGWVRRLVSAEYQPDESIGYPFTHVMRWSALDLLPKRKPDYLGQCTDYAGLSTGLLRSLGLQTRDVWSWLDKKSRGDHGGHAWNEILVAESGTEDSKWYNYDALWAFHGNKLEYEARGYTCAYVWADIVPMSNGSTLTWCHDGDAEGCDFCNPHDGDSYDCGKCGGFIYYPCVTYLSSENVTAYYRPGGGSPKGRRYDNIALSLTAPIYVERGTGFSLTAAISNGGPDTKYSITVQLPLRIWASDYADVYSATNPEFAIDSLPPGTVDTLEWTVVPLVSGCPSLLVRSFDSAETFYTSACIVQNVNEPGTLLNLGIIASASPRSAAPGESIDFAAEVFDNYFDVATDAIVTSHVQSVTYPGYEDSLTLTYSSSDSSHVGSFALPYSAPLGDYRCLTKCSMTGFDSDSQFTYFSVKPLLSLAVSTDDSVYDCRDTVLLIAILQDRGDTVGEAVLGANVRTSLGDYLIPMESDSTNVYHCNFAPADLVPYFGDTTLAAGMWDLVVTTDYYGGAAADTAHVRVKVPDLSVIAADIIFAPSEPDTGEAVLISAKVRNIGTAASDSSILCFYVDQLDSSAQIGADYELPILQVNDSATISFMWNTEGLSGTHTIYVQVDPDRISIDSRRFNNSASATVYISSYVRGDVNGDGVIDISDVVYLLNYLFINGPAPDPLWLGDATCDGLVDASDLVYLLNYLFAHGPAPSC